MRLIGPKYKTREGAAKRAAFENGISKGEFERGDKAHVYRYIVVQQEVDGKTVWRVARTIP